MMQDHRHGKVLGTFEKSSVESSFVDNFGSVLNGALAIREECVSGNMTCKEFASSQLGRDQSKDCVRSIINAWKGEGRTNKKWMKLVALCRSQEQERTSVVSGYRYASVLEMAVNVRFECVYHGMTPSQFVQRLSHSPGYTNITEYDIRCIVNAWRGRGRTSEKWSDVVTSCNKQKVISHAAGVQTVPVTLGVFNTENDSAVPSLATTRATEGSSIVSMAGTSPQNMLDSGPEAKMPAVVNGHSTTTEPLLPCTITQALAASLLNRGAQVNHRGSTSERSSFETVPATLGVFNTENDSAAASLPQIPVQPSAKMAFATRATGGTSIVSMEGTSPSEFYDPEENRMDDAKMPAEVNGPSAMTEPLLACKTTRALAASLPNHEAEVPREAPGVAPSHGQKRARSPEQATTAERIDHDIRGLEFRIRVWKAEKREKIRVLKALKLEQLRNELRLLKEESDEE